MLHNTLKDKICELSGLLFKLHVVSAKLACSSLHMPTIGLSSCCAKIRFTVVGQHDFVGAKRVAATALYSGLVVSIIFMAFVLLFLEPRRTGT